MKLTLGSALLVATLVAIAMAGPKLASSQTATAPPQHADVERGKYLVENVAMCTECHTPRDANNDLDHSRWLQGARIWIMPTKPMGNWAYEAPALAGLPSFTDAQAENVLEQGIAADGRQIQPPMHIYHLTHADALAIIAYLRSLPSRPQ